MTQNTPLYPGQSEWAAGWLAGDTQAFDSIQIKKIYIDINDGNHADAAMFHQIMYWHGTGKNGKPRLKVERDGFLWLAKSHDDWWEECRVNGRNARNCIQRIADRGLIITKRYKFQGVVTVHVRVDWKALEFAIRQKLSNSEPIRQDLSNGNDKSCRIQGSDKSCRMEVTDSVESYTDNYQQLISTDYQQHSPFNSPKGEESEGGATEGEVRHQNQSGEIMMSAEPQKSIETAAQLEVITTTDNEPMKSEPVATSDKEEPSTGNTRKKKASNPADYTPEFLEFWKLYPRCTNKGQAFKAWQQKIKAGHEAQEIMDFLRHELSDRDSRLRREEKFVPHGGTWLNSEDWTNEGWRKKRAASGNAPNASGSNLMAEFQSFQQEAQRHGERIELVQSGGDLIRYCVIRPNGQRDRTQIFQSGTLNMYRQVWALAKVAS